MIYTYYRVKRTRSYWSIQQSDSAASEDIDVLLAAICSQIVEHNYSSSLFLAIIDNLVGKFQYHRLFAVVIYLVKHLFLTIRYAAKYVLSFVLGGNKGMLYRLCRILPIMRALFPQVSCA